MKNDKPLAVGTRVKLSRNFHALFSPIGVIVKHLFTSDNVLYGYEIRIEGNDGNIHTAGVYTTAVSVLASDRLRLAAKRNR